MNEELLSKIEALVDVMETATEKNFRVELQEAEKTKLLEQVNLNLEINRDYLSEISYKLSNIEQMITANHLALIKEIKSSEK